MTTNITHTSRQRLRIGLLIQQGDQPQSVIDFLRHGESSQHYVVDTIFVLPPQPKQTSHLLSFQRWLGAIEQRFFALINLLERKFLLAKNPRTNAYFTRHKIDSIPIKKINITNGENFSEQVDLLVLSHQVQMQEKFLSFAKQGVVFLASLTKPQQPKTAWGFDEVLTRRASTTFFIKKIDQDRQSLTLYKGKAYTASHFLMNEINFLERGYYFLHHALENYDSKKPVQKISQGEMVDDVKPISIPPASQQISYLMKLFSHYFKKRLWKLQKKSQRWGVAYQFTDDWHKADLSTSVIIQNPPNHFLADPFLTYHDGAHYCFLEDFDYATRKGKISVYQIKPNEVRWIGTALEEPFHLSYPFVFEASGKLYMCPETYQANEIRLYECKSFPLQWQLHQVLKTNVSAADTNIFEWNGRWWMLANIDSLGHDEHHAELHVFYADTFDATDWQPHPLNPVIHDPLKARNAGLLIKDHQLYRVFQQHGFDNYGESMAIAKITKLDPSSYEEELLYKIPADFFNDLSGAHSYCYLNGLLVLDFKKLENIAN